MTENEAIIQLNFDMEMIIFNPYTGENLTLEQIKAHNEDNYKTYLADELAITALTEIQQYRAIGTVEEIENSFKKTINAFEKANPLIKSALDILQEYQRIGTIDEFKALKEKNEAKKPIFKFEYEDGRQFYDCPVCGAYVMHAGVQSKEKYCSNCGQKLDWSE